MKIKEWINSVINNLIKKGNKNKKLEEIKDEETVCITKGPIKVEKYIPENKTARKLYYLYKTSRKFRVKKKLMKRINEQE